jgi:hypothetical protein
MGRRASSIFEAGWHLIGAARGSKVILGNDALDRITLVNQRVQPVVICPAINFETAEVEIIGGWAQRKYHFMRALLGVMFGRIKR